MSLALVACHHRLRRPLGGVEFVSGEDATTLLVDAGWSGRERGGQGAVDLVDQRLGLRPVAGASPCAIARRRASPTGTQTCGLQVLFESRQCLPRLGCTRNGGAASFLHGFDIHITLLTSLPVDGALGLKLAGLGVDKYPALRNPAVSRRQLVIAIARLKRRQGLGVDLRQSGWGCAQGRRHTGDPLSSPSGRASGDWLHDRGHDQPRCRSPHTWCATARCGYGSPGHTLRHHCCCH